MKCLVANVIEIENPTEEVIKYCKENLIKVNPEFEKKKRMGLWLGNTQELLYLYWEKNNSVIVPFGTFKNIWNIVKNKKEVEFEIFFSEKERFFKESNIELYDYQKQAVNQMVKAKNGILIAPCGSGKTFMGLEIIRRIGLKALWIVHTERLRNQAKEDALNTIKDIKVSDIADGKIDTSGEIVFATIQTLYRCDLDLLVDEFGTIVVDECHHIAGSFSNFTMYSKVLNNLSARYKYGLTATPNRADGLIDSMFAIIGNKEFEITRNDIDKNIMKSQYNKVEICLDYDVDMYTNTDGTLNYIELVNYICGNDTRNKIIADNVIRLFKERKKQMILCSRVNQCQILYELLKDYNAVFIKRGKVKEDFTDYNIIISTFQLAREGLDCKELDTLHLASPIGDKTAIIQSKGRIERVCKNKLTPQIYDYVDINISYCVRLYKKRLNIIKKY